MFSCFFERHNGQVWEWNDSQPKPEIQFTKWLHLCPILQSGVILASAKTLLFQVQCIFSPREASLLKYMLCNSHNYNIIIIYSLSQHQTVMYSNAI